jgi:hypothetical protein
LGTGVFTVGSLQAETSKIPTRAAVSRTAVLRATVIGSTNSVHRCSSFPEINPPDRRIAATHHRITATTTGSPQPPPDHRNHHRITATHHRFTPLVAGGTGSAVRRRRVSLTAEAAQRTVNR